MSVTLSRIMFLVVDAPAGTGIAKILPIQLSRPECDAASLQGMRYRQNVKAVPKERRSIARRVINRVAQYHCGMGALPRTCMVTDISAGGARLYSEIDMPDIFTLAVTVEDAEMRRDCRVVWRLGGEIGVTFTDGRP